MSGVAGIMTKFKAMIYTAENANAQDKHLSKREQ